MQEGQGRKRALVIGLKKQEKNEQLECKLPENVGRKLKKQIPVFVADAAKTIAQLLLSSRQMLLDHQRMYLDINNSNHNNKHNSTMVS